MFMAWGNFISSLRRRKNAEQRKTKNSLEQETCISNGVYVWWLNYMWHIDETKLDYLNPILPASCTQICVRSQRKQFKNKRMYKTV